MRRSRLVAIAALVACGPEPAPEDKSSDATSGPNGATTGPSTTGATTDPTTDPTTGVDDSTSLPASTTAFPGFDVLVPTTVGETAASTSDATGEPEIDPFECPLGWPRTTQVSGTTPLGPRTWTAAGFGETGGECGGTLYVQLMPAAPDSVDALFTEESLFVTVNWSWEWEMAGIPFPGVGPAHFTLKQDGWLGEPLAEATGEVSITTFESGTDPWPPDPSDWPRVTGEFTLKADGWDLAGSFESDFCGNLYLPCP